MGALRDQAVLNIRKRVLHGLPKRARSLGFDLVQIDTGLILE